MDVIKGFLGLVSECQPNGNLKTKAKTRHPGFIVTRKKEKLAQGAQSE